jgi:hypothetical protein
MWTIAGGIILAVVIIAVAITVLIGLFAAFGAIGREIEDARLRRLRSRAEKGNANAQFQLAETGCYGWPEGEREKWYRKAAEQGHTEAEYMLGMTLYYPATHEEAAYWLRRASEKRHQLAQGVLAGMYELGHGVPYDLSEAYRWHYLAAEDGNLISIDDRDKLLTQMTPEQIQVADRLVAECRAARDTRRLIRATLQTA